MTASIAVSWAFVSAGILKQPEQHAGQNLQVHSRYMAYTEAYATLSEVSGGSCHYCLLIWSSGTSWRFATSVTAYRLISCCVNSR